MTNTGRFIPKLPRLVLEHNIDGGTCLVILKWGQVPPDLGERVHAAHIEEATEGMLLDIPPLVRRISFIGGGLGKMGSGCRLNGVGCLCLRLWRRFWDKILYGLPYYNGKAVFQVGCNQA